MNVRRWTALIILTFVLTAGVACGDAEESDPTPVQTFKITPAATRSPSPAETEPVDAGPTAPLAETATAPAGDGTTLEIAAINVLFDKEELTAPAGTITIEFDNRDGGVLHNIHVYRGSDASGEDIATTEIEAGPVEQTLTMDLEPGEYFYVCDVHPTTMTGTLIVT